MKFNRIYKQIINESGLNILWDKTQKHACGVITSFRGTLPYRVNRENNKKLLAYLIDKGYSVTSVQGTYIENFKTKEQKEADKKNGIPEEEEIYVNESSFFVCNHKVDGHDFGELERELFKLGKHFNQDTVLIIPVGGENTYLLETSKTPGLIVGFKEKYPLGKGRYGNYAQAFISRIKGRPFAYQFDKDDDDKNKNEQEEIKIQELYAPETINGLRVMKIILNTFMKELEE